MLPKRKINDVSNLSGSIKLCIIIIIINIDKTALFEPYPSLKDSARLHLAYISLDFVTIFVYSKVISLASNSQPGGPGPCIYVPQWQGCPLITPRHQAPFSLPSTTHRGKVEVF
jgi:hypothetical protein